MSVIPLPLQGNARPEFKVDQQVQPDLTRDLVLMQVEEDIDGMKRLHAVLTAIGPRDGQANEQLHWLDGAVLDFGKEVIVNMGAEAARGEVFKGRVSALELSMDQGRAPEVTLMAEDKLMDLRMTRRFKTYENVSDADLVQQIASQHGLQGQADVDGPTHASIQQWNQSDLAFLRERARRMGADVWLDGNTLHMATRDQRQGQQITLIQGNSLISVRLRADLAQQRSEVHVGGWDDAQAESIDEQAAASEVAAEAQGQTHGVTVLQRAFGDRVSHRVREVPLKGDEARAWAKASMLARARRFITAHGVADGLSQIQVGALLRLERVSPAFEGDGYYVTRVRHQYDLTNGYRTHFEAERAWIGRMS
ncbi:MAG: contractile injection system protein, VgrG/Pvc8 family [Aquabacterium sp.]